jgi:hypothetical protein
MAAISARALRGRFAPECHLLILTLSNHVGAKSDLINGAIN